MPLIPFTGTGCWMQSGNMPPLSIPLSTLHTRHHHPHQDRGSSSTDRSRGKEGGQVCQPHPRASLLPNRSGDNGCSWPMHQGAPQGPRSLGNPDNREGGSYHLPRPEAVSGSAAGQLYLSEGHHRPTWFWPFLLTKLPTRNVILFMYVYTYYY